MRKTPFPEIPPINMKNLRAKMEGKLNGVLSPSPSSEQSKTTFKENVDRVAQVGFEDILIYSLSFALNIVCL